jgi:hypothetical protein
MRVLQRLAGTVGRAGHVRSGLSAGNSGPTTQAVVTTFRQPHEQLYVRYHAFPNALIAVFT